jgi:Protein of unknown function (DUF3179)
MKTMTRYTWYSSLLYLLAGLVAAVAWTTPIGYQAVPKDAFPVFDHPDMLTAKAAEREGAIYPRDIVIGVYHGGEAKAYPITVMGTHELGNDTIDGIPIAVSW